MPGGQGFLRIADGAGFAGSHGLVIDVAPEDAAAIPQMLTAFQRLPCRQRCGKVAQVSFLLRLTDLRAHSAADAEGYRCGLTAFLRYRDGVAGRHLNNDGLGLTTTVTGSHDWRLVAFRSPIPEQAGGLAFSLGLRGPASGRMQIDEVEIAYLDP